MSSKVYKVGPPSLEPVQWRSVGQGAPQPLRQDPFPAIRSQSTQEDAEKIRALEQRLRAVEQETERRSQAAFQQGQQQGDSHARQQMAGQVNSTVEQLAKCIADVSALRAQFRHQAEEDLVKLALAIARRILHREIAMDPGALMSLVKVALDKLDLRELYRVRVHTDHAPALRQFLDRMGLPGKVEIEADPGLPPGSAIFDTSRGTLDCSTGTQLAEIERGFADIVRHSK